MAHSDGREPNEGRRGIVFAERHPTADLVLGIVRGLVGGFVGAVVGYYACLWMARQGFYAIILPGSLLGLGFGAQVGRKSVVLGILAGILGVAAGLYTEAHLFRADPSFRHLLGRVHQLPPVTLILIALGGLIAFWFGRGHQWVSLRRNVTGRNDPR